MVVDDSIIVHYLNGDNNDSIRDHWVFNNIESGKYMYEIPDISYKDDVIEILNKMKNTLLEFTPLNENIYTMLYPEWKYIINEMTVLFIVGCPSPYDAMVRKYDGKEYIIFDIIRFCDYKQQGLNIELLIKQLITHETSHLCLHKQYPNPSSDDIIEQIKYNTFNEGYAHLLAFKDNINKFDFTNIINEHYNSSCIKLKEAMNEKKYKKQITLLEESNSGAYWGKFAAISGKLFLAKNLNSLKTLYDDGIDNFVYSIINSID